MKDQEGGDAPRARRFAGAGEHSIDVGDAAIGDPGLLAVQATSVAVLGAASAIAATSEPASFAEREGRDLVAAPDLGETSPRCSRNRPV